MWLGLRGGCQYRAATIFGMPTRFAARVKLYASAVRLNSARTFSRPRIRKYPWFIHCLMLPNGCSTVSRRTWSISGRAAKTFGHAVEHRLIGPAADPSMGIRGATRFERAGPTGTGVAVTDQGVPLDLPVVAGFETLSAGAKIGVAARVVVKLFLAEQPMADRRPALRVSNVGIDAGLFAGLDILAFVVALVGDGIEPRHAEHFFGGAGGLREQPEIAAGVGHFLGDDQLVLSIDRDLRIIAHPHFRI